MSGPPSAHPRAAVDQQQPAVPGAGAALPAGVVVASADLSPDTSVPVTTCTVSGMSPEEAVRHVPSQAAPGGGVVVPRVAPPQAGPEAVEAPQHQAWVLLADPASRDQGQAATLSGRDSSSHSTEHRPPSSSGQLQLPPLSSSGGHIRRLPSIATPFSLPSSSSQGAQLLRAPSSGLPSPRSTSLSLAHSGSRALSSSMLSTTMSTPASAARGSPAGPAASSSSSGSSPAQPAQAVRAYHWSPEKRACSVFFARVPPSVSSQEVEAVFASAGRVAEVQLYRTFVKCRVSKGCGVVRYETPGEALNAIHNLNGRTIWSHARHPLFVTCIKTAEQLPASAGPADGATSSSSSSSSKAARGGGGAGTRGGPGAPAGGGELCAAVSAMLQQMNVTRAGGSGPPADAVEVAGSDQQQQQQQQQHHHTRLSSYSALQTGRGGMIAGAQALPHLVQSLPPPAAAAAGGVGHQQHNLLAQHHHQQHQQQQQQQQVVWVPVALGVPAQGGAAAPDLPTGLPALQHQMASQQQVLAVQQSGPQGVPGLQLTMSGISQQGAQVGPARQSGLGLQQQQQALPHMHVQGGHGMLPLAAQEAPYHDHGLAAAGGTGCCGSLGAVMHMPGAAVVSSGVAAQGPGGVYGSSSSSSQGVGPMQLVPLVGQGQGVWAAHHASALQPHADGMMQYQQQHMVYTSMPAPTGTGSVVPVGPGGGLVAAAGGQVVGYTHLQQQQPPHHSWVPVPGVDASGQLHLPPGQAGVQGLTAMLPAAPPWTEGTLSDIPGALHMQQQQQQQLACEQVAPLAWLHDPVHPVQQ